MLKIRFVDGSNAYLLLSIFPFGIRFSTIKETLGGSQMCLCFWPCRLFLICKGDRFLSPFTLH